MDTEIKEKRGLDFRIIIVAILVLALFYLVYLLFSDNSIYSISLKGDNPFYLTMGEEYVDPGYVAYDEKMQDVTSKVKIKKTIDNNVAGEYIVTYKIGKSEVSRKIIVTDKNLKINFTYIDDLTNQEVKLEVKVIGKAFNKIILPDGSEKIENEFTYNVLENGEYHFKAYNNEGEMFEETIEITNIDKNPPTGECSAIIDKDNTEIVVNAKDENGISEYNYIEKGASIQKSKQSTYNHNAKLSKNIIVEVSDTAGNIGSFKCNITDNTVYDPIMPSISDNVVYRGETDTLKVYVIKRSSYYLTRIWVENPYEQLNKFDSPEYGKELYKPSILLEKAMNAYNLSNKLLLGFNASGFYLKDTYDASSVSKYPAFNKTSVGTIVITNGVLIRNVYDKAYKTWYIMGVNPDNQMVIFDDLKADTSAEITAKKSWADSVVNSKIRNTYTFAAPLIKNGVRTNITTSMPGGFDDPKGLQMICQINDNNFVLFTSSNEKRNTGINEFLNMGCQTATNLDGGGSIALVYKDPSNQEIKTVIGNNRSLPEVAYFSE